MFDLLKRAERRATKAVAVFERATADLRTANEHLAEVKARAEDAAAKTRARAEAEVARIEAAAERLVHHHTSRVAAADAAAASNHRILTKIESLLS